MSGFDFETALPGPQPQTNTWLTPLSLLQKLGTFDLDPCAAPAPRPWSTARWHYDFSQGQNGLKLPWTGRVWCNPPYGRGVGQWMRRLSEHGSGIALIFARTETAAWQNEVWPRAKGLLFLRGRIRFCTADGKPANNAGSPSVLVAYSTADSSVLRSCGLEGHFLDCGTHHA